MKKACASWCLLVALACCALSAREATAQGELRRRAYFGMAYVALTPEQAKTAGVAATDGVLVRQVLPGGPAEHAGVRAGDVITRLGPLAVGRDRTFGDLLRLFYEGDTVGIEVVRDGKRTTLALEAIAPPRERGEGLDVEYTAFTTGGHVRLRAVVVSPEGSSGRRLPAVLMVTALGSPRLIDTPGYFSPRAVAHAVARAGFRVLRFELRGSGDSEGDDYRGMSLTAEIADNLAAFDALRTRADVDPARVFLYGHSTGALEAAVLAGQRSVAGLIVSGTVGRTYYERMAETLRLQSVLAGTPQVEADANVARYLTFSAAVASGLSKAEILQRHPDYTSFFNAADRIMDDRTLEFWREQMTLNMARTYAAIKAPVLIMWGESDFLTQRACHEHIRDVLLASGRTDVKLATIPGLDHLYAQAKDFAESFSHYKTGAFVENPAAKETIAAWLRAHANGPPSSS